MVSCAHLSVALRVALGASTWPGKRGFTIRRSSPTQRRNGRAFSSLTARGGGLPIGVTPNLDVFDSEVVFWRVPTELTSRHDRLLLGEQMGKDIFSSLSELESV